MAKGKNPSRRNKKGIHEEKLRTYSALEELHKIQSEFSLPEMKRHSDIVRNALDQRFVDWQKVDKSIIYIKEFRSAISKPISEFAKSVRIALRSGRLSAEQVKHEEEDVHKMKANLDAFDLVLSNIEKRRKKELG